MYTYTDIQTFLGVESEKKFNSKNKEHPNSHTVYIFPHKSHFIQNLNTTAKG